MTIVIIIITLAVSVAAFKRHELFEKLLFNAARVHHDREYYRLISYGFLHAGWEHLIVNMIVLYSFGRSIEILFHRAFGGSATFYFLVLYFGGLLISNGITLFKYKDNYNYNAVGASGAVSAVLFAAIFFNPWAKIYFFGILPIPGILFALLYVAYSYHMSRRQHDNVAHDAHLLGALFGFIFPVLLNGSLLRHFIDQLLFR